MLGRGLEALIPPQGSTPASPFTEPELEAPAGQPYAELPSVPQEQLLTQHLPPTPLMLHVHDDDVPSFGTRVEPAQPQPAAERYPAPIVEQPSYQERYAPMHEAAPVSEYSPTYPVAYSTPFNETNYPPAQPQPQPQPRLKFRFAVAPKQFQAQRLLLCCSLKFC